MRQFCCIFEKKSTATLFDPFFVFRSKKCLNAKLLVADEKCLPFFLVWELIFTLPLWLHQLANFYYPYAANESKLYSTLIEAIPKILNWFKCFLKVDLASRFETNIFICFLSFDNSKDFRTVHGCTVVPHISSFFFLKEPSLLDYSPSPFPKLLVRNIKMIL